MKRKLVFVAVLVCAIAGLVLNVVSYSAVDTAVNRTIQERLMAQANDWRIIVDAYEKNIKAYEENAQIQAKQITTVQVEMVYELIDKALRDNGGVLPNNIEEDMLNRLSQHKVGKTGYVFVLDYKGTYILSKDRARDGENIWDIKDADGNSPIHSIISVGRALAGSQVDYHTYLWLNIGEKEPRPKIAALIHFPQIGWIVGATAYYDDVIDVEYGKQIREYVKDLMAEQVIGRSGYIGLATSTGIYVVSKDRLRDGEDVSQSKDAEGRLFIQEGIKKAKAAGTGVDFIVYPWQNPGEDKPRMKASGLAYVGDWDSVIWATAYYDDIGSANGMMGLIIIVLSSLLVVGLLSYGVMSYRLFRH
ncbi:cache domain-containing protein [Chloroflexota bacterium]